MEDRPGIAVVLAVAVIDEAAMSVEVAVVVGERGSGVSKKANRYVFSLVALS